MKKEKNSVRQVLQTFWEEVGCHKRYFLVVLFFAVLSYGYSVTHQTISIDDLRRDYYLGRQATKLSGRWGMVFWTRLMGAKKYDRVPVILRTVILCSVAISTVLAAALLFASEPIFALFTSDEAVLASASILVVPAVLNFYGSATRSMSFSLINGSGNTRLNFAVAIIDGMISRIGIAALLGFVMGMGCQGFWYGDALAGFMPMVIGMCYYLSGSWKPKEIGDASGSHR